MFETIKKNMEAIEITVLILLMLFVALWQAGCVEFIHGYVIPDLLESKIESVAPINAAQDAPRDRRHNSLDNLTEVRGRR